MSHSTIKRSLIILAIIAVSLGYSVVAFVCLPDAPSDLPYVKYPASVACGALGTLFTAAILRGLWELSGEILSWMEKQK